MKLKIGELLEVINLALKVIYAFIMDKGIGEKEV